MNCSKLPRMRTERSNYGFRRMVEHAIASHRPEKVLSAAGRRWLAAKAQHYGYGSVILGDLYSIGRGIAEKGGSTEQLVDLVDIAVWKLSLTPEYAQPLFGAEQALRARAGEWERAIHQVDSLGSVDDQLLVHAEVALLKKKEGGDVGIHLGVIRRAARNADPEMVEFVAERLATTFPDLSILLAKNIPVPKHRFDVAFREMPNPGRCLWHVFAAVAEGDIDQARELRPDRSIPFERVHANLGILQAIMGTGAVDLKNHIRELLDDVEAVVPGAPVETFVTAFMIREGAGLPLKQYVEMLDELCGAVGASVMFPWLVPAIDECLAKDLNAMRAAVSCMHQRDLRDLFYWRMKVMGAETDGVCPSQDTILGLDLTKADTAASMARTRFDETKSIVASIKTTIGAVHAFTRMADHLAEQDWGLAQALLKTGFDLLGDDMEVAACYSRLEVLRVLVQRDGPFRNDAVAMSIAGTQEISPIMLRHEMFVQLGRYLAVAFCGWTDEELGFWVHVNSCCQESDQRRAIQKGIVSGLTHSASVELGKILLGEGRNARDDDHNNVGSAVDVPGCDPHFLAALAERVVARDRERAASLFGKAAEAASILDAGDERNRAARDVIFYVLKSVPEWAWEVYRRCGCDELIFTEAAESALNTLVRRKFGRRRCWLRCCMEHALCRREVNAGKLPNRRAVEAAFEATKISKDPLAIEMNRGWRLSESWCRGVVDAFRRYLRGVQGIEPWKKFARYQLQAAMEYLANLTWSSFMAIAEDAEIAEDAVYPVRQKELTRMLLTLDVDPRVALRDVEHVQGALKEKKITDDSPIQDIRDWLLAWGAALAPDFTAEEVAGLPAIDRMRFVRYLEHVQSRQPWNRDQLTTFVKSFTEHEADANTLGACMHLLAWLAATSSVDVTDLTDLSARLSGCRDGRVQLSIAEDLKRVSPHMAARLLIGALEHAETRADGETLFNALAHVRKAIEREDGESDIGASEFRKYLKKEWSRSSDGSRTVTLSVDQAADLLAGINIDDEKRRLAALRSAAQVIGLKTPRDVALLYECVKENRSIKSEGEKEFVKQIALQAVKQGVCQWHDVAHVIDDPGTRSELLNDLVAMMDLDQNRALIDQAALEAERLEAGNQSSAFLRIGDSLLSRDVSASTTFYIRALEAACCHPNASCLLYTARSLVDRCIRHSKLDVQQLSAKVEEIASRDIWSSRENVEFYGWNEVSMLAAGLMVWPRDSHRFQQCCHRAKSESFSADYPLCDYLLERAYTSAYEVYGVERARKLFMEVFEVVPTEVHQQLADKVVSWCLAHRSAGRPLECYQVWRYAPERHHVPLIQDLLWVCSKPTAAVAHLSLSMCGGGDGSPVDAQALEKSWELLQDSGSSFDRRLKRDLMTMHAIVHGVPGAIESLLELLPDPNKRNFNLAGIVAAAINSVSCSDRLLRELWSRMARSYGV